MVTKISHLPDLIDVNDEIELRAKTPAQYPAFESVAIENREHLLDYMPWAENIPNEGSSEHYAKAAREKQNNISADWDIYIDGTMSGAMGIKTREEDSPILEIGYWLVQDAVGKGVVTACTNMLVDLLFNETDTPAIEIACDKSNIRSAAVPIRCGFTLDREVDRSHSENKARCDTNTGQFYKLTREEWENRSLGYVRDDSL